MSGSSTLIDRDRRDRAASLSVLERNATILLSRGAGHDYIARECGVTEPEVYEALCRARAKLEGRAV